jgi:transposase-like protein
MNQGESKEQVSLPSCPNPDGRESHVVRNGSHRGRPRYHCRNCKTYFGETQGTPMYGLKTPATEVAQALLIVMRRGSLRAAEEITGHKYEPISGWLKRAATHTANTASIATNVGKNAVGGKPRPYPLRAWQADSYRVGETLAVSLVLL